MINEKERLNHLKYRGFNPKIILDIGAYKGEWASKANQVWPDSKIFCFEANKNNEKHLQHCGFPYIITFLGDEDGQTVNFYQMYSYKAVTGDSAFKEMTRHYSGSNVCVESIPMKTLDNLLQANGVSEVDFIKIDTQGSELMVLDGGKKTLENAKAVLLEASVQQYNKNAPKINDVIQYMNAQKFKIYDFLEMHYLPDKTLFQTDILFIKEGSELFSKGLLC